MEQHPPLEPTTPPDRPVSSGGPTGPGGLRRSLATIALSLGLLVVGGGAVVLAASPDPSASSAPTTTVDPSVDGSTATDPARPRRGTKADCPEGAGNGIDSGAGDSGGTGESTPSSDPSAAPSTAPTADPTQLPAATPAT